MAKAILAGVLLLLSAGGVYLFTDFSLSADDTSSQKRLAEYRVVECWFPLPYNRNVRCGHLVTRERVMREKVTQERVTQRATRTFTLPVVIIEDNSLVRHPDPVVYLNGGPGSDNFLSGDSIQHWLDWLDTANLSRDLVLTEFRGTGRSQPQYRCDGYQQHLRETLKQNLSLEADAKRLIAAVAGCVAEFQHQGFTLVDFSTPVYAEDLHRLQDVLNYPAWNIMGSSYGTRVAMELTRAYPGDVRAVILDSVYPPGKGGLLHWPKNLADSFATLWRDCEPENPSCAESLVNADTFWQTVAALNQKPLSIQVSLWHGDWPMDIVVNGHRFVFAAYGALYRASGRSTIAQTLREIAAGETETLKKLMEQSINGDLDPTFNPFTYFMVDCAENYRPAPAEFETVRQQFPMFDDITRDAVALDVCQQFPLLENFTKFSNLQRDETPTLFLSGTLDPVTPVRWLESIKSHYPNGQVWRMPNISHGVSANSNCVLASLRHFLDAPNASHPNPCLDE